MPSLLSDLRQRQPELPVALRHIAEQILADPAAVAGLSIGELAERTGTSLATVSRFCHAVGVDGYGALKVAIATEVGRASQAQWELDIGGEIGPDDPLDHVAHVIAAADARAIQETAARLDPAELARLARAIKAARRVEIFGIGGSAAGADELRFRLRRIGIPAWASTEAHDGLTMAASLTSDDVVLIVSHTGRTVEALDVLAEAKANGAMVAVLTNFPRSALARDADLVLLTSVHETTFRSAALAARHSQLLLVDLIFVAVAQLDHARTIRTLEATTRAVSSRLVQDDSTPRTRRRSR